MTSTERDRLRLALFVKQRGKCKRCRTKLTLERMKPNSMHLDHVNPKAHGGADHPVNIELVCRTCNLTKSDRLIAGTQRTLFDGIRVTRRHGRPRRELTVTVGASGRVVKPIAERMAAWRGRRLDSGVCTRCAKVPARPGKTTCAPCNATAAAAVKASRARRKAERAETFDADALAQAIAENLGLRANP